MEAKNTNSNRMFLHQGMDPRWRSEESEHVVQYGNPHEDTERDDTEHFDRLVEHTSNDHEPKQPPPREQESPRISISPSLHKRGYLFKWADRSIGWGGSKWGLRFVVLEDGRLSYFGSHTETASPRYTLTLRGCAVRDDGWKRNRRHVWKPSRQQRRQRNDGQQEKDEDEQPPLDEPGAYFFVFSVYERPDEADVNDETTEEVIVPLLRFSTLSSAEKSQWMQLISKTCAYCETDEFLQDEADRAAEQTRRREEEATMAKAMPESRNETLSALYFAPPAKPLALSQRMPSVPSFARKLNCIPHSKKNFITVSANADLDKAEARSKRNYPASKPMHRSAEPSLLSPDAKTQNFRGFLNLGFLILIVSNFRLLLDTIRNHGLVLTQAMARIEDSSNWKGDPWQHFPFITAFLFQLGFVTLAFAVEWMLGRKPQMIDETLGMCLHYLNAITALGVPVVVVWTLIDSPVTGGILLFHATITCLKLISYAQANEDYRHTEGHVDTLQAPRRMVQDLDLAEANLTYPENVTLGNIIYFWCAPTLTYQIAFPKFPRVRWWKIATILTRMLGVSVLGAFLIAQVVNPVLNGLLRDLEEAQGNFTLHIFAEYWLKLSIASTYLWLLTFYGYFHLYLNLWAELLRFGDRVFYGDWWNSATASAFWRLWNMPVHYWLVRHVYFPCIRLKMGKAAASFTVFLLSAIVHELLVSVPFHMVRPWSFLGMLLQIPLVAVTKYLYQRFPGSSIGNFIFWVSFCVVGQPMAVLMYTVDYQYHQRSRMQPDL